MSSLICALKHKLAFFLQNYINLKDIFLKEYPFTILMSNNFTLFCHIIFFFAYLLYLGENNKNNKCERDKGSGMTKINMHKTRR